MICPSLILIKLLYVQVTMTGEKDMLNIINFDNMQMKPLLYGLINQTILPFNDLTMNISKGDKLGISFNNTLFKDYQLLITNVTHTNLKNVTSKDISENGFIYKPAFLAFLKDFRDIEKNDSIVKLDFELIDGSDLNARDN